MKKSLGFIGLGIMGRPMAKNLLKSGFLLTVFSRSKGPVADLVKEGAFSAESPRDVAAQHPLDARGDREVRRVPAGPRLIPAADIHQGASGPFRL